LARRRELPGFPAIAQAVDFPTTTPPVRLDGGEFVSDVDDYGPLTARNLFFGRLFTQPAQMFAQFSTNSSPFRRNHVLKEAFLHQTRAQPPRSVKINGLLNRVGVGSASVCVPRARCLFVDSIVLACGLACASGVAGTEAMLDGKRQASAATAASVSSFLR
jgi:hypothetical protein